MIISVLHRKLKLLAEVCSAPIFLTTKAQAKRGKEKAKKMENETVKAKHIPTLQWLLTTLSLMRGQGQCMTDYLNLYYDLTVRCALRTSLKRFFLKIKITKTQTTTKNHGMPGICIHSTPDDKGHRFSLLVSFIFSKPPNSEEESNFFFFFYFFFLILSFFQHFQ